MLLELDSPESSLLYRIIRNRLHELRNEVHHCKDSETQAYLRYKERLLNRILARFAEVDEQAHTTGFEANAGT